MDYFGKLPSYLQDFTYQQLKNFLGNNLFDLLIEWMPENEVSIPKSKLIDMIFTIHGFDLLKNKEFRKAILTKLNSDKLETLRPLMGRRVLLLNTNELIDEIANKAWGNNKLSTQVLSLLELNNEVVEKGSINEVSSEIINSPETFFELLDYQYIIRQKILHIINSDVLVPRLLVHMPTGTGKTKTTMHTLTHHYAFNLKKKGLVIWLAHTNELLQQAYDTFKSVWKHIGSGDVNLFKLWGKNNPLETSTSFDGIAISGYQKMIQIMKNKPDLFEKICRNCVLIIVDEAHKSVADETRKVISDLMRLKENYVNRALVGLSATPGRNMEDNEENSKLVRMYENRIISIDTALLVQLKHSSSELDNINTEKDIISHFQEQKILAKLIREKLNYDGPLSSTEIRKIRIQATANGYSDFSKDFLKTIALNKRRNTAIINKIDQLHAERIPTIIFSCSVEHGRLLSSALSLKGIKNAFIYGEMNTTSRAELINRFKNRNDDLNILINYEVLTTGFDSTNIRCVFITRPTQSIVLYSQMIGRGLRGVKMGGNEECLLIDIEDNLDKYTNESMAFSYFDNYWG